MIASTVKLDLGKLPFLKGSLQNKAMRIAVNKAAAPVKQTVIATAPELKGNLRKSVKIKVVFYKAKSIWSAIIGPSTSFKRAGKKIKRGPHKGQKGVIKPFKYAPIVESKRHFLRKSLSTGREQFINTLCQSLRQQIEQLLAKK